MFLFLEVNVKPTPRGLGHINLASYWSAQKAFFASHWLEECANSTPANLTSDPAYNAWDY